MTAPMTGAMTGAMTAAEFLVRVAGGILIPAGTKARKCYKCPAMIYDVVNPTSGRVGVASIAPYKNAPAGIAPTATEYGAGISHFADCPKAAEFRSRGRGV